MTVKQIIYFIPNKKQCFRFLLISQSLQIFFHIFFLYKFSFMDYFPVILIFIPFESKFFKTKIKSFSHRFCLSILFIFKNFICFVVLIYSPLSHTKTSKTIPFFKIDFPFYVTPPPPPHFAI